MCNFCFTYLKRNCLPSFLTCPSYQQLEHGCGSHPLIRQKLKQQQNCKKKNPGPLNGPQEAYLAWSQQTFSVKGLIVVNALDCMGHIFSVTIIQLCQSRTKAVLDNGLTVNEYSPRMSECLTVNDSMKECCWGPKRKICL